MSATKKNKKQPWEFKPESKTYQAWIKTPEGQKWLKDKEVKDAEVIPKQTANQSEDPINQIAPPKNLTAGGLGTDVEALLNDTPIAPVTKAVKKVLFGDSKDCGCDERKKDLNKLPGFTKRRLRPSCMSRETFDKWAAFRNKRTLQVLSTRAPKEDVELVSKVYTEVFRAPVNVCSSCGGRFFRSLIERVDAVWEYYEKELKALNNGEA